MIKKLYYYLASVTLILLLLTVGYEALSTKCEMSTVVIRIDSCNWIGDCAILGIDGTVGIARLPHIDIPTQINCKVDYGFVTKLWSKL